MINYALTGNDTAGLTPASIFEEFQKHANVDFWSAYQVPKTERKTFDMNSKDVWFEYDPRWKELYTKNNLHHVDPVMKFAHLTTYAVNWCSLVSQFCRDGTYRDFISKADANGISSGVCLGPRQINGDMQIITFARRDKTAFNECELNLATYYGQIMGRAVNLQRAKEDPCDLPKITERAVECLELCALGKTSSEIECILGISRHTVDFHVRNAMKALNTTTRTFAVVRAVQLGIVQAH